jgi:hypothetical protein
MLLSRRGGHSVDEQRRTRAPAGDHCRGRLEDGTTWDALLTHIRIRSCCRYRILDAFPKNALLLSAFVASFFLAFPPYTSTTLTPSLAVAVVLFADTRTARTVVS